MYIVVEMEPVSVTCMFIFMDVHREEKILEMDTSGNLGCYPWQKPTTLS